MATLLGACAAFPPVRLNSSRPAMKSKQSYSVLFPSTILHPIRTRLGILVTVSGYPLLVYPLLRFHLSAPSPRHPRSPQLGQTSPSRRLRIQLYTTHSPGPSMQVTNTAGLQETPRTRTCHLRAGTTAKGYLGSLTRQTFANYRSGAFAKELSAKL